MTATNRPSVLSTVLLEASPDCVKVLNPDGRLAMMNSAGCRVMEIEDVSRVYGLPWTSFWPEPMQPMVRDAVTIARAGGTTRFEGECPTLKGTVKYWDVTVSPVHDVDGRVTSLLGVSRDVTEQRNAARALRDAEERQRLLLESAQEGICTVDLQGIVTYANPRLGEMLGAASDDLIGDSVFDWLAPSAVPSARARFANRTQGGADPQVDVALTRRDGTTLWARVAAGTLTDSSGDVVGAVYLASDVTTEHAAREDLARRERYFRALIERAMDLIAVLSPDGCITYATPAWAELLGYQPEEVVGRDAMGFIYEDDLAPIQTALANLVASPGSTIRVEYQAIHKDGSTRTLQSIARNLLEDEAVRGIVVNSRDVTEERMAEEQLHRQTELLEGIFGNIPAMITLYTSDGCPIYANPEWERVMGWSAADRMKPETFVRLFENPEEAEDVRAFALAAIPGVWRDTRMRARDGRVIEATWTSVRLSDGAIVCFGRDVTEERRLGAHLRQAQKMEAIGQLTAGIAHDFNNLLQVITGNAHFARERIECDSAPYRDLVQIQVAAERAAALTRQLLAFSRQQVLRPEPVDLDEAVVAMQGLLERTLGEDIALTTRLGGDIVVTADRHQLEQVIMNLAVNARDAMPTGGVLMIETFRVEVKATASEIPERLEPGSYAALVVRDTGIGMDAATRARIFEPFFTTKEIGMGTGLGLATVHGIVHQSGGTITVESAPGRGSTFTVYLPCSSEESSARVSEPSVVPGARGETILVAEDDEAVRSMVRRLLEHAGYSVVEAVDGRDAISRIERGDGVQFQLLLTDAMMPGAGAREVIDATNSARPEIPILVMSGHSADVVERRGQLWPGIDVLVKPFTAAELLRRVRASIDARTRR